MPEFTNNSTSINFQLNMQINRKQADILNKQLQEIKNTSHDPDVMLFFRHFSNVDSGIYNSFIFKFNSSILKLSKNKRAQLEEILNDILLETEWFENLMTINSIEYEIKAYTKEEIINENLVNNYMDSLSSCGYELSYNDLYNVFGEYLTKEEIDKYSLLHRMKNEIRIV